ncbi:MAG: J domain-containing protein [Deltaproteobacteria bacterium]|nr:J domain-containing protein [Deltaproteobacteria bacterium]
MHGRGSLENPDGIKVYQILQAVFLGFVLVTGILYFVRKRRLERDAGATPDVNAYAALRRSRIAGSPAPAAAAQRQAPERADSREPPLALASDFPSWSKTTPPHELLGIAVDADEGAIEKAYKRLLKKYHPDRFAGAGRGHQARAHQVVLLVQEARDRMLSSCKRRT